MSTNRLLEIKSQIDDAKSKLSENAGQTKSEIDRMQKQFGVSKIPEAEKELKKIGTELDKKEAEFKKGQEKLENAYDWD